MTDTSSKGLFPQLTDVLYALAESHAKLLTTVQCLRSERVAAPTFSTSLPDVLPKPHLIPSDNVQVAGTGKVTTSPVLATASAMSNDDAVPTGLAVETHSDVVAIPEPTTQALIQDEDACSDGGPFTTLALEREMASRLLDMQGPTPTLNHRDQLDQNDAAPSPPTGAALDGRNYNYFDDLDAQLAGLEVKNPDQSADHS